MLTATLFCPSRGRPAAAWEVWQSFHSTKTSPEMEMVFLVDDDDPTIGEYPQRLIVGLPAGNPTRPLNDAVKASTADIVGFIGDDSRFTTNGWDRKVFTALEDGPAMVWGDDGHQKPWPSTAFVSKQITNALGWMVPPTLQRGYFDVVWVTLGDMTKTARVIDASFPHDNSAGDPTSMNFKSEAQVPPGVIESDRIAFQRWLKDESKRDATKIRHAIYQ